LLRFLLLKLLAFYASVASASASATSTIELIS
jgi:hypothetical protein